MKKTPKNSSKKETPKEKEKEQETEKEKEISLIEKWNEHMKIIKKKNWNTRRNSNICNNCNINNSIS